MKIGKIQYKAMPPSAGNNPAFEIAILRNKACAKNLMSLNKLVYSLLQSD